MAERSTFEKKEAIYFALVLVVSILSLTISVATLFIHEYRHTSIMKTINTLDKKSQEHEDYIQSLKSNQYFGEKQKRSIPQEQKGMSQIIDWEIKNKIHVFMNDLHKVYCLENDKLVIVGAKGEPGYLGPKGSIGLSGPRGEMGSSGTKGEIGNPGISVSSPVITKPPKSLISKPGHSVSFTCEADGLPRPLVTWHRLSGALPSGNHVIYDNGTFVITNVATGDEGVYVCLAKNVLGEAKAFVSFDILMPVQFKLKPSNAAVSVGSRVQLYCEAKGFPPPVITWYKGNHTNQGETFKVNATTIVFSNTESNDSGVYTCVAHNIINKVEAKAQLLVLEPIKFTVKPPSNAVGHVGQTITFDCRGWGGVVEPSITWTRDDGQPIHEYQVLRNGTLVLIITSMSDATQYTCTAKHALASVSTTMVLEVYVRSCSEWRMSGEMRSEIYKIDPDGPGGVQEFQISCDMEFKGGIGVTEFSHDSEVRSIVAGYSNRGSFLRDINYTQASTEQIVSLIEASRNCEQFIKYECRHSVLLWHGLAYGWWVSRDGDKMDYWGGATPGSWKCACGMTKTCHDGRACNCDVNDDVWREDSGLLSDKTTLPVSQLRFGDTGNARFETGYYTLGKLKCYGIV